jgi:uncharacterized membrane protein YfcA
MVPALVSLGFSRHRANATSLATIMLVAISGAVVFGVAGDLDVPIALGLGFGGLIGSTIGAHWMNRLSGPTLARIFGVVLLTAGGRLIIGGDIRSASMVDGLALSLVVAAVIGLVAGISSGLAGIGGGVIMIPAMVFLLAIDQHTAEGTSLVAILFTAAAGTRVNMKNGHVNWRAVLLLGLSGAVMAPLAALAAQRIPADDLSRIFGVFVVLTAFRTLWTSRPKTAN